MREVYCSECKYLETQYAATTYRCVHPSVCKETIVRDWFSADLAKTKGDPKRMNANNDCKLFAARRD